MIAKITAGRQPHDAMEEAMTTETTPVIIGPPPPLHPSGDHRGIQPTDDRTRTPGERARMRMMALGIEEPPPRPIADIADWLWEGR